MDIEITPQYIAGFFDGEGSIGLYFSARDGYYRPALEITQKNPKILEAFQTYFRTHGLELSLSNSQKMARLKNGTPQNCHRLRSSNMVGILGVLEILRPYLISKRKQADLMIEYLNHVRSHGFDAHEGEIYSKALKECKINEYKPTVA